MIFALGVEWRIIGWQGDVGNFWGLLANYWNELPAQTS
jgi:hypothetical protein